MGNSNGEKKKVIDLCLKELKALQGIECIILSYVILKGESRYYCFKIFVDVPDEEARRELLNKIHGTEFDFNNTKETLPSGCKVYFKATPELEEVPREMRSEWISRISESGEVIYSKYCQEK